MQDNPFAKSKKIYCTFYIVRHGETELNVNGLIQGNGIDSSLTEKGLGQVKKVARELRKIKFDAVYSSDLLRAKKTAEIIVLEHKLLVETTKLIRERKYGKFEGKPRNLLNQFNDLYEKMSNEERFHHKIDKDAESDEELVTRFITFLREAALTHPKKTVLVVTHGGLMRVFLQHVGFADFRYFRTSYITNASYIKLLSDGVDFFVQETKGIDKNAHKNSE